VAGGGSGSLDRPRLSLIVDLNLPPLLAQPLIDRGIPAVHWSSIGPLTSLDAVILAHTRQSHAVLVTHDLDFSAILAASGDESPSVIQIRLHDLTAARVAGTVERLVVEHRGALEEGALVSVSESGARVRLLPLIR
jgi:predicted nuclease of predicted toxin-antitoxin system